MDTHSFLTADEQFLTELKKMGPMTVKERKTSEHTPVEDKAGSIAPAGWSGNDALIYLQNVQPSVAAGGAAA